MAQDYLLGEGKAPVLLTFTPAQQMVEMQTAGPDEGAKL